MRCRRSLLVMLIIILRDKTTWVIGQVDTGLRTRAVCDFFFPRLEEILKLLNLIVGILLLSVLTSSTINVEICKAVAQP